MTNGHLTLFNLLRINNTCLNHLKLFSMYRNLAQRLCTFIYRQLFINMSTSLILKGSNNMSYCLKIRKNYSKHVKIIETCETNLTTCQNNGNLKISKMPR